MFRVEGEMPPPERNVDLTYFTPERAHQFLQGFYREFLHHNNGLHLYEGVPDDGICQRRWRRLAAQSDN